jgi:bifunctional DNA-binding transcriptional regulator/antitoxin component of YhaV-PrlF toxin-antitoxin module
MRAIIDDEGGIVIPKDILEQSGMVPGDVEVTAHGLGVRIEPVIDDGLVEKRGRLVVRGGGTVLRDEDVRRLRDAGNR